MSLRAANVTRHWKDGYDCRKAELSQILGSVLERHTSNHFEKPDMAVEKQSDLKVQVEKLSDFQGQ